MKVTLSEFSYGYAVTEELIYWRGEAITGVRYFPSLYQEGQTGAGFDVRLNRPGLPLFIQFKLAEYIKVLSNRIDEVRRGYFTVPFYRMYIRSKKQSRQHASLMKLERKGYETRYVAPIFHRAEELNEYYFDRTVCDNSIFVSPLDIGRFNDNKEHHISYSDDMSFYRYSKPRKLRALCSFEDFTRRVRERYREAHGQGFEYWQIVSRQVENAIKEGASESKEDAASIDEVFTRLAEIGNPIRRIGYLARAFLASEFYIVREKEESFVEQNNTQKVS